MQVQVQVQAMLTKKRHCLTRCWPQMMRCGWYISRKRKAKVDGSNRPLKTQKCVIVEVPQLPFFRTDKSKAPKQARKTQKRHGGASPALSEKEVSVYNFDIFRH